MSAVLGSALYYRGLGWSVVPIKPGSKAPLVNWTEYQERLPHLSEIRGWYERWPDAGVAIVTGAVSGIVVLDVDGQEGWDFVLDQEFPETLCVNTRKGKHYYFKHPGFRCRNFVRKLPDIDFRGDGGYVLAPPTVHPEGGEYTWLPGTNPGHRELAECPEWLRQLLDTADDAEKRKTQVAEAPPLHSSALSASSAVNVLIPQGRRNSTLMSLAGAMRRKAMGEEAILAALLVENSSRCAPPLEDQEVRTIAKSVARYAPAPVNGSSTEAGAEGASQIAHQPSNISPFSASSASSAVNKDLNAFHLTDAGNAEAYAELYRDDLRYLVGSGKWLRWNGRIWSEDSGEGRRLAIDMVNERRRAAQLIEDRKERSKILNWLHKSESAGHIKAVPEIARTFEHMQVTREELDKDPWFLTCRNVTIDLRTMETLPHDRSRFITRMVNQDYDPDAESPRWEQYLMEVFEGNEDLVDYVQRAVGYSLTGNTRERCFFLCHGSRGNNGKSVFLDTLGEIADSHSATCDFQTFGTAREQNGIRNDLARLSGIRLVRASESTEGFRLSESVIKTLTGGFDRIPVRFLHQEHFEFRPQFKLWLATNHKPVIRDAGDAVWRRVHLIPFNQCFEGETEDKDLRSKLTAECAGILAWAVRGCLRWRDEGLNPPDVVVSATREYRQENDVVGQYLSERCVIDPPAEEGDVLSSEPSTVRAGELYGDFREWCERNGERPMTGTMFGRRISERGFQKARGISGKLYIGLGLQAER